jgi:prolipoprotein diacylglyceryltransferase
MWFFTALAVVFGALFLYRLAQRSRNKLRLIFNHGFLCFLFALFFARIFFVIENHFLYFYEFSLNEFLGLFYVWDHGLNLFGAAVGLLLAVFFVARQYGEDVGSWFDRVVPAMIFASVFVNFGAYFEGLHYGRESDLPWAVSYQSGMVHYTVPIHPVQIYAALFALVLSLILYKVLKIKFATVSWNVTFLSLFVFSLGNFFFGFFRGDLVWEWILRSEQWFSLFLMVVVGVAWFLKQRRDGILLEN